MKYLIDLTPRQVLSIQKLLDNANYGSLSQFINASIENQLALEESYSGDLTPFRFEQNEARLASAKLSKGESGFEKYRTINIPTFNSTVEPLGFEKLVYASQDINENQVWIWGQINKIFPVKFGVRVLHQLLATRQAIELNEFLDIVTKEAAAIGDKIRGYEEANNKMRDEKISAALPSSDEKSQARYKFQFMVYPRKDGLLDGAMALMKFCNIYAEKKKNMIGITDAGLKFSSIPNPVIDKDNLDVSLSKEESIFYIEHCKENVKGEYGAMKWMLQEINNGKTDRESLNEKIEESFGAIWKATDAVINTQRSGLTARMFELGLIKKEKDGIYVKYNVSDLGKQTFEF